MNPVELPVEPSILLVRHSKTVDNERGVLMGILDSPLTDAAVLATKALGVDLAAAPHSELIGHVYSSDLERAALTALIIADALGVALTIESRFRERNFGEYNGRGLSTLQSDPSWARVDVEYQQRPQSGGESLLDVEERIFNALFELDDAVAGDKHIMCVGHSTGWRLITEVLLNRRQSVFSEPIPANLSIGVLSRRRLREERQTRSNRKLDSTMEGR